MIFLKFTEEFNWRVMKWIMKHVVLLTCLLVWWLCDCGCQVCDIYICYDMAMTILPIINTLCGNKEEHLFSVSWMWLLHLQMDGSVNICTVISCPLKVKVTWHMTKYGDTYSEFVLCIYPSKVHTHSSEHTHREHTPGAAGSHLCCSTQGAVALLKGTSAVVLRAEIALDIHSAHLQFLLARDLNSQLFDYELDSLTIRPWLPQGGRIMD